MGSPSYYKCCNCCSAEFNGLPGARAYIDHIYSGRVMRWSILAPRDGETWEEVMTTRERMILGEQ